MSACLAGSVASRTCLTGSVASGTEACLAAGSTPSDRDVQLYSCCNARVGRHKDHMTKNFHALAHQRYVAPLAEEPLITPRFPKQHVYDLLPLQRKLRLGSV